MVCAIIPSLQLETKRQSCEAQVTSLQFPGVDCLRLFSF
jgi:hypothetical protein